MPTPEASSDLPELLREAEVEAERLVSLARMAVALGLVMFFAIAVPPTDELRDAVLARQGFFALLTMLAYLLVGGVIWLSIRTRLFHRWMIWPAATTDALFVLLSIWTGMENTHLTGDAMFVFPSVWLIPVVLSFGVLRGNPWVLAWTAFLVVVGVAGLVAFQAGSAKGQDDSAVWLFLALPPNVMRLIMITLAGIVLVAAAHRTRTRTLVHRSIDATIRNANLTRYLPAKLAPQLAAGHLDDLRHGRREDIAVLFIDIRGFTQLSEGMTPQEVSDFVTEFRHRVARVVDAHDGVIDKFMGDAAMVLFTEPDDPHRAAANGLACATDLHRAMTRWSTRRVALGQQPVSAGIGLHFGAVFSGVVGDETRLEYSVFGDTVNVAARLQEMSKTLNSPVLASREAVSAAQAEGWHHIAQTALRGRQGDMDIMAPVVGENGSDPEKRLQ